VRFPVKIVLPIAIYVLSVLGLQVAALVMFLGVAVLPATAVVVGSWLLVNGLAGLYVWGAMICITVRSQRRNQEKARSLVLGAIQRAMAGDHNTRETVQ